MKKSLLILLTISVSIFSCKKDFATFQGGSSTSYSAVKANKAILTIEEKTEKTSPEENLSVTNAEVISSEIVPQTDAISNEIAKIETQNQNNIETKSATMITSKKRSSFVQKALEKNIVKKMTKHSASSNNAAGKTDILALLSLIFGAAGLLLFGSIGWLIGVAGFILGLIALKKKTPNRTMAILGVVFGGIAVLVGLLVIVALGSLLAL